MRDAAFAARLGRTYRHHVTAFRAGERGGERKICRGVPCALSRAAQVSAPTPPDRGGPLPEAAYRISLFTGPETAFELGDRIEVSAGEQVYHAWAADSFCYPSHCLTVLEINEVQRKTAMEEGEGSLQQG